MQAYHISRHTARAVGLGVLLSLGCGRTATGPRGPAERAAVASTAGHEATTGPLRASAISLDDLPPYFLPGESMTWNLTLLGIRGGRARIAIGSPGMIDGRRIIAISGEAESAGLAALVNKARDSISSLVDVRSGLPTRTDSETELRGKILRVKTTRNADSPVAQLLVWRGSGAETKREVKLPTLRTHDTMTAMLVLRAWDAPPGARAVLHTLGGVRLWRTDLEVGARQIIDTPLGRRAAVRIDAVSRRLTPAFTEDPARPVRTFTVWMSDDDARIPLRLHFKTEYGEIAMQATSYAAPE